MNNRPKPVTPYERLIRKAMQFESAVVFPRRKEMWTYQADRLAEGWRLDDLASRVAAADTLGWDVRLKVKDGALVVEYVKRPEVPSW